jgi:hypothetical protein
VQVRHLPTCEHNRNIILYMPSSLPAGKNSYMYLHPRISVGIKFTRGEIACPFQGRGGGSLPLSYTVVEEEVAAAIVGRRAMGE